MDTLEHQPSNNYFDSERAALSRGSLDMSHSLEFFERGGIAGILLCIACVVGENPSVSFIVFACYVCWHVVVWKLCSIYLFCHCMT